MHKNDWLDVKKSLDFSPNRFDSLMALLINLTIGGLGIFLIQYDHAIVKFLGAIVLGFYFFQCWMIAHECGHFSFFKSRKTNIIIGHIFSAFSFMPFYTKMQIHNEHHRWSGTFKEPPVETAMNTFMSMNPLLYKTLNVLWMSWFPFLAYNELFSTWKKTFDFNDKSKNKIRKRMISLAVMVVAIGIAIYFAKHILLSPFFFVAMTTYMFLLEFITFPHHVGAEILDSDKPLPYYEQDIATRSCKPIPLLSKYVFFNFNYHIAHHFYPNLPWMHLETAEKRIREKTKIHTGEAISEASWNIESRSQELKGTFYQYYDPQILKKVLGKG